VKKCKFNFLSQNFLSGIKRNCVYLCIPSFRWLVNHLPVQSHFPDNIGKFIKLNWFDKFDNNATNNGRSGICLTDSTLNNLTGNNASFNAENGINLHNSSGNFLTDNTAFNNTLYGILLNSSSNENVLTGNNASFNGEAGFGIVDSQGNNLTGNAATGNLGAGFSLVNATGNNLTANDAVANVLCGISLHNATLNNLFDNNATNNGMSGICLTDSPLNNVSGNNASHNAINGINLFNSSNNTLDTNSVTGNGIAGIFLNGTSNNNTLTDNLATHNTVAGIIVRDSGYNNLTGNDVLFNLDSGIYLFNSTHNLINGNNMSYNEKSGMILDSSDSNTVMSNYITHNNQSGILLNSSGNNLIYNNYFNNWNNTEFNGSTPANTWNVPKTPGQNIIGGGLLGGNYWARPDGTGWSQTQPTDTDGFVIYPLVLASNNTDYLPLGEKYIPPVPPVPPGPVPIPPRPSLYWNAAFVSDTIPSEMCACRNYSVNVTVNNTGTTGWLQNDVDLGAYNDDARKFNPIRVTLEPGTFVGPEQTYTFQFELKTPCTPGIYNPQYRMIRNDGFWFGDILKLTIDVRDCGNMTGTIVTQARGKVSTADLISRHASGTPADSAILLGGTGVSYEHMNVQEMTVTRPGIYPQTSTQERLDKFREVQTVNTAGRIHEILVSRGILSLLAISVAG